MKRQNPKLADVRKALSGKVVSPKATISIRGGENLELYPWIDQPGG